LSFNFQEFLGQKSKEIQEIILVRGNKGIKDFSLFITIRIYFWAFFNVFSLFFLFILLK